MSKSVHCCICFAAVVISEKLHFKFSMVRILTDLTFVAVGFLLGSSLGVGTIICAFLVGSVAGFFLPYSEKYINKIVQRCDGTLK